MKRITMRSLMLAAILSSIAVWNGCTDRGTFVRYKDLSGPFFKKEIGCTIYFVFHPEHETKGLKRYMYPMADLYAIKPNGKLERQYVPNGKTWAWDFALTDYGFPIVIWESTRINILENKDEIKNGLAFFWVWMEAVSFDGKRALVHILSPDQESSMKTAEAIDLTSGKSLFTAELPWDLSDWSCGGAGNGLKNILAIHQAEADPNTVEGPTRWEPYLLHFDNDNKLTYWMLQFPPPEPKGKKEVVMIPSDGRIIGVTHDGQTARFYQSYPPYDEFTLLLSLEIPPVEIETYNRDGTRLCMKWVDDETKGHYSVLDTQTGANIELFTKDRNSWKVYVSLSPMGDRLGLLEYAAGEASEGKFVFSVYDALSGALVDSAEWPYKGHILHIRVGY